LNRSPLTTYIFFQDDSQMLIENQIKLGCTYAERNGSGVAVSLSRLDCLKVEKTQINYNAKEERS
jgi:hypothetical protein